jgi:hypothetical protein
VGTEPDNLAVSLNVVENPEMIEALNPAETAAAFLKLLGITERLRAKFNADAQARQVVIQRGEGDRLLDSSELMERLKCSEQTLQRALKARRWPFIWKEGGRILGSQRGLEQWIKRHSQRATL